MLSIIACHKPATSHARLQAPRVIDKNRFLIYVSFRRSALKYGITCTRAREPPSYIENFLFKKIAIYGYRMLDSHIWL